MPGRPPKPTQLHVLKGTARAGRMSKRGTEPKVDSAVGAPPEWLGEHGKREWQRIAADEVYSHVIRANHRPSFEHYCVLYQRFVEDAQGTRAMTASERQTFNSLGMQFGFTPASQAKVSMPEEKKPVSEWDLIVNK